MLFGFNNEIHPSLISKFELSEQPLLAEPASATLFYENDTIKMLANGISQSIQQEQIEICLIKGEHGIGKSSFAEYLHTLDKNYHSFIFNNQKRNHLALLFKAIIDDENFVSEDTQVLAKQAAIEIFHLLRNQKQPVLIIDDAHTLREKTFQAFLRFMLAIRQQGVGALKLVLLAEKSIEKLIEKAPDDTLTDEKIYTALMRPLNPNEINAYLSHRFSQSGCAELPLKEKDLNEIASHSSGLPSLVNSKAAQILNGSKSSPLMQNKRIQFGGYIAAALIFIGLAYFYIDQQNILENSEPNEAITLDDDNVDSENVIAQSSDESIDKPIDQLASLEDNSAESDVKPSFQLEQLNLSDETVATTALAISADQINNQENTTLEMISDIATTDSPSSIENLDSGNTELDSSLESAPERPLLSSGEISLEQPPIVEANEISSPVTEVDNRSLYSHRWLMQQNPNDFVLQLLGTANYKQMVSFSENLISNCQMAYFRTLRNQAIWHVLLCGPYESSQAAVEDIKNLPVAVQNNKPWPRSIATIQESIRQAL